MPELPEVETTMRGLRPLLTGMRIEKVSLRTKQLRFPFPPRFAARLAGQTITHLSRRAKYILAHLSGGETLLLHLGMSGRFVRSDAKLPFAKHDHVIITTAKHQFRYHDPRRFGVMDIIQAGQAHKLLAKLGPEPLEDELNSAYLQNALARKTASIKALLLDQRLIAGLGNIYVCEILHLAGIHPTRSGGSLKKKEIERLPAAIKQVISAAIDAGGTSMRDYVQADGALGFFQDKFTVYARENMPCFNCGRLIERITQSGRSSFFCPKCQK